MNKQEIKRSITMEYEDKKYICYDILMECLVKQGFGDIFDYYINMLLEENIDE